MGNRIVAVGLIGLSMALLTSCAGLRVTFIERPGGYPASQAARDRELMSEEYERKKQEKHEERVDELSRAYEEFLKSQGTIVPPAEEAEQSAVKIKDDTDNL